MALISLAEKPKSEEFEEREEKKRGGFSRDLA
jgi:hypothetical protein